MKHFQSSLIASLLLTAFAGGCNTEADNSFAIKVTPNTQAPAPAAESNDSDSPDPNNPYTPTVASVQGLWKMKSGVVNGTGLPASMINASTLLIKDETYDVNAGGNSDKGTVEPDMATTPYRMTIKSVEGTNAGNTLLAIFDMPNESTLRVCYDMTGTDFPKDYESTSENGFFSTVYKRQP